MTTSAHHRLFSLVVVWTLGLLWLGSVVHATESSLACPDWPTCFGTMMPEMTGGVFWEHLHRLVAGGLVLAFLVATVFAWRPEVSRPWVRRACLWGLAALVVQSVLGGLTVIFRLPDALSSTHLGLAFAFLGLAVVLAVVTGPRWAVDTGTDPTGRGRIRRWSLWGAGLVFLQSVLGAAVRHTDAGMACPDVPLCLGRLVPPLSNGLVALHFSHRALGYGVFAFVVVVFWIVRRSTDSAPLRRLAAASVVAVCTQVVLGFASVMTTLGVGPVSLHTLVAATVLALLVALATRTWAPPPAGAIDARATEGQAVAVGGSP